MSATSETIQNVISHQIGSEAMAKLGKKFGYNEVLWALENAGEFYKGCEEIGSSDVYYMIQSFLCNLGLNHNMDYPNSAEMIAATLNLPD